MIKKYQAISWSTRPIREVMIERESDKSVWIKHHDFSKERQERKILGG